jgi:hypothetical protein
MKTANITIDAQTLAYIASISATHGIDFTVATELFALLTAPAAAN